MHYTGKSELALNFIDRYLELQPSSEIGYYFKGKILSGLKEFSSSIDCFKQALKIKKTSRSKYRIGRLKEDGLEEMYEAIVINSSSGCAHRHFADAAMKKRLFEKDLSSFQKNYDENSDLPVVMGINIRRIFEQGNIDNKDFIDYLNKLSIIMNKNKKMNEVIDENNYIDYNEDDSSYDQYGGIYGFDDDTIGSAFEGDPDNYWNID